MATYTGNLDAYINTDAEFRAWASAIDTAILGCGLVDAGDTGQINLTTVSQPGASDTFMGYKVYAFNDVLQATLSIYLKVEFGSGGTSDRPALRVTVGRSTNGAGTLSGGNVTKTLKPGGSKADGDTLPYFISGRCSGSNGHLHVCVNNDASSDTYGYYFSIERPKTVDGTDTADGFLFCAASPFLVYAVAKPSTGSGANGSGTDTWPAVCDNGGTHDYGDESSGTNEWGDNLRMPLGGKAFYSYNVITAEGTLTKNQSYACDSLGSSRTYMHIGNVAGGGSGLSYGIHASAHMYWEGAAGGADTIYTGTKTAVVPGTGGASVPTGGQIWPRGNRQ